VEAPVAVDGFTKTVAWHERTHRSPAHRRMRTVPFAVCAKLD
jgi:hypothetical protein